MFYPHLIFISDHILIIFRRHQGEHSACLPQALEGVGGESPPHDLSPHDPLSQTRMQTSDST